MPSSPFVVAVICSSILCGGLQAQQSRYAKTQLSPDYLTEGAALGDLNGDGASDLVAGPHWWEGPNFTIRHDLYPPIVFGYFVHADSFFSFIDDFDGDGDQDVMGIDVPGQPAIWRENPGNGVGVWTTHLVTPLLGCEAPQFTQLVAGGSFELVAAQGSSFGYFTPNPASATAPWDYHAIIFAGVNLTFTHSLGVGDLNGDGRADVVTGYGWLEQPASLVGDPVWTFHAFSFSPLIGSGIVVYDVDGDGDQDFACSRDGHGYGLSWFENAGAQPGLAFVEHVILSTNPAAPAPQFSQLHCLLKLDVDGDGLDDLVTGKTVLAHNGTDPGAYDPPVVYAFLLDRTGGVVTWTPALIDDFSGLGRQATAGDVDGDGRLEIVTSNKLGTHLLRPRRIRSDVDQVSAAAGGSQTLFLDFGPTHGGMGYLVLGSVTGISPGVGLGGFVLPLAADDYLHFTLTEANSAIFMNTLGFLDGAGKATATLDVPAGLSLTTPLILYHSVLAFSLSGTILGVGESVTLELVP